MGEHNSCRIYKKGTRRHAFRSQVYCVYEALNGSELIIFVINSQLAQRVLANRTAEVYYLLGNNLAETKAMTSSSKSARIDGNLFIVVANFLNLSQGQNDKIESPGPAANNARER